MLNVPESQATSLSQAVELFKSEFRKQHPESQFLIDGGGYEDEHLDLIIYAPGDQLELERLAVEISLAVQASTGYFILPFAQPSVDPLR